MPASPPEIGSGRPPRLRPARAADLPALALLYEAGQRQIHPGRAEAWAAGGFADAVAGEEITVAAIEGEVVGFLSLWRPERFVHFLHVRADRRGRSIGSRLLQHARAGVGGPLQLKCAPHNRAALAFYIRLGWLEVERALLGHAPYVRLRSPR
jgi:ribosomal protein S18 acetylase RimI-like enzyme